MPSRMSDDEDVIPLHPDQDPERFPVKGLCVLICSVLDAPTVTACHVADLERDGYEVLTHDESIQARGLLEAIARAYAVALTPSAVKLCGKNRVWGTAVVLAGALGLEILDAMTLKPFDGGRGVQPDEGTSDVSADHQAPLILTEPLSATLRAAAAALREDACADVHDADRTTLTALELIRAHRLEAIALGAEGSTTTERTPA